MSHHVLHPCPKNAYPVSSAVFPHLTQRAFVWMQNLEQKRNIDWDERLELLIEILSLTGNPGYECIIGVSGGKDSYFQVHFVKEN